MQQLRRSLTTVALALSVTMPSALALAGRPADAATSGAAAAAFSPIYMAGGGRLTPTQVRQIAMKSNIVAGNVQQLSGNVALMRSVKPGIAITVYLKGAYSVPGSKYPESDYAHSAAHARIRNPQFGTYLMEPSSADWRARVVAACQLALNRSSADACFLDSMGIANLSPGYNTAVPVDPATGHTYTSVHWLRWVSMIASSAAKLTPHARLISNGIGAGGKYFSGPTSMLAANSPVAMSEVFLRSPGTEPTLFPESTVWKMNVDMLVNAAAHGYRIVTVTKIWRRGTAAQVTQWHNYAIATFLLGANWASAFCFTAAQNVNGLSAGNADAQGLGTPTGAYSQVGGAFRRLYTGGLALVNPNTTATTVSLNGVFIDANGGKHSGSITLAPHTGAVLHAA